ncbi:hypothetical protein X975_26332, partial [Stegodyphus mimosarum]
MKSSQIRNLLLERLISMVLLLFAVFLFLYYYFSPATFVNSLACLKKTSSILMNVHPIFQETEGNTPLDDFL